jgi:hypothetical protein
MDIENTGSPLGELKKKFSDWRQNRKNKTEPIPRELWEEAAILTKNQPIAQISKALHLEYKKLKDTANALFDKKLQMQRKTKLKKQKVPTFLELDLKSKGSTFDTQGYRCEIMLQEESGRQVKISFSELPPARWLSKVLATSLR